MNNDPIVEEVRRIRDELARKFNYDVHAICADLRAREQIVDLDHPLVSQPEDWAEKQLLLREEPPKSDE